MERLTKQGQDFENQFCDEVNCRFYGEPNGCNNPNYSCSSFCYFTSVAEMLEKYEDTELTPELIEAMRGHNSELINQNADLQAENAALKARLDKAVELPCKVGDTVYRTVNLVNGMTKVVKGMISDFSRDMFCNKDHIYFKDSPIFYNIWLDADEFGKTVFLTKEEAEQALTK